MTEGQASGVLLGTLQAKDPDEGENGTVFYSLSGIVLAGSNEKNHPCQVTIQRLFYVCKYAMCGGLRKS